MNYNYHTHTQRSNHAAGAEEEYVLRAIENGIEYMGFSDHIPLKFADGTESMYRVATAEGKIYCDEIKALAEKHKDKIDLKVGFESEYYPELFDGMLKNVIEYGGEYLILGAHFAKPENTGGEHACDETDSATILSRQVENVIEAMNTRAFTYVAHPDIFNFVGDESIYQEEMRKICVTSRALGIPLEINFLGMRTKRHYPQPKFWKIAGEEKAPVTFGFDAHDTQGAYDGASLSVAKEMVKEFNLNYIGKPELILINRL